MPIGINTELSAKHQVSPGGPVITALVTALVEGYRLLGWPEKQNAHPISIKEVLPDGSVALDLQRSATYIAEERDRASREKGLVGIAGIIAKRRLSAELKTIPRDVQGAMFSRAAIQILDKLYGKKTEGVILSRPLDRSG